jgi:hypothetical protein
VHAQDEHARRRCGCTQLGRYPKAGFSGHRYVQNNNIGVKRCGKTQGLQTIRGLSHHLESRLPLEDVPDPTPYYRMVVDDENTDHCLGHYFAP